MKSVLFAAAAMLTAAPVSATVFQYADFSDTTGLTINGDAATAVDANNRDVLRLARTRGLGDIGDFDAGSAFSTSTVQLASNASFSTKFSFNFNLPAGDQDGDGPGADGLVFVVQTISNTVGTNGGGIGYQNIDNSVGVEFDTYGNGRALNDPDGNHIAINTDGNFDGTAVSVAQRFNDGNDVFAWVDYNGATDLLEVRYSFVDSRPLAATVSRTLDLVNILGSTDAFVGFTSATGSASNNHDLLSWEFRGDFNPIGSVPAPGALGLLGLGIMGIALRRRTKA